MLHRLQALYRARLRAQLGGGVLPAAPLLAHGSLAAVLCLLVRDALDPFGFALFALTPIPPRSGRSRCPRIRSSVVSRKARSR